MGIITSEKFMSWTERIAFILLGVLVADLCIFGAGRLIEFGPLTFRMLLLVILFIFCTPLFLKNLKELLKCKYIIFGISFLALLVLTAVIGFLNNNRTELIITDLKGFAYFAFLPCAIILMNSREKILTLSKIAMYSAAVLALIHIVFICFYIAEAPWITAFESFCWDRKFFYISYQISAQNVRVSFLSLICLLLGTAFSIYFSVKENTKISKTVYPVITAICVFSLFMSYTRSVYLALAVTAIVFVVFLLFASAKKERTSALKNITVAMVVFFIIVGGFYAKTGENYFTYGLSRVFVGMEFSENNNDDTTVSSSNDKSDVSSSNDGNDSSAGAQEDDDTSSTTSQTEEIPYHPELDSFQQNTIMSDSLRATTVNDLINNIKESPLIGLGLGAEIPSRPSGLNEYFFLDLMSKMGIIGFGCYISPIIFMAVELFRLFRAKQKDVLLATAWFCVLLGLVAYSYFTPCMNSSVGILLYCCTMGVFEFYKNLRKKQEVN